MEAENIDTAQEKEFAVKMKHHRIEFLKYQAAEEETIKKVEEPKYMCESSYILETASLGM